VASALFGPDGTQAPEPDEALPDVLAAPAMLDSWVPLVLPSIPDITELQRAASALPPASRPAAPRYPPQQQPSRVSSTHKAPPRQTAPSSYPMPVTSRPSPSVRRPGTPPPASRQLAPVPSRPPVPSQRVKDPLIQGSSGSGGSRIGCIVFLIFIFAAVAKPLQSLIEALLDLFR
jgi:hypothetical protein